jgi:histidine triad (HIT) family protein
VTTCIFCEIASRTQSATVVHESPHFICFLPLVQEVPGHTLIASKAHYESISDAPSNLGEDLMQVCKRLQAHYMQSSGAPDFNLLSANGVAAQQSVLHLHLHFLPRRHGDGVDAWPVLSAVL